MSISEDNSTEPKMHAKRLGRELAMQFLFRSDMNNEFPDLSKWDDIYPQLKEEHGLSDNRYARKGVEYAELLITGVASNRDKIDAAIRTRSENWEWERLGHVDCNIMRVAVYEMLFVPEVPPVVSINEAVEIARDYCGEKTGNFINGVLNGVKDTLSRPAREAVSSL